MNRVLFDSGRESFFEAVLGTHVFTQKPHLSLKMLSKLTRVEHFRTHFFSEKKTVNIEKCVWTAQAWTDCI